MHSLTRHFREVYDMDGYCYSMMIDCEKGRQFRARVVDSEGNTVSGPNGDLASRRFLTIENAVGDLDHLVDNMINIPYNT